MSTHVRSSISKPVVRGLQNYKGYKELHHYYRASQE